MRLRFPRFLFLCLVGCVLKAGLSPPPSPASNQEKGLRETRRKIRVEKEVLQDLEVKGKNLLESLESLDKEIVVAERRSRVSETRMTGLEKEKKETMRELKTLEEKSP